jgi:hypothetical protein
MRDLEVQSLEGPDAPIPTENNTPVDKTSIRMAQHTILSSLAFSGMEAREVAISESYRKTEEWIFKRADELADNFNGEPMD